MLSTLASNSLYLLTSSLGQKILAFLYFALIARYLGVLDTGSYFFALSFVAMFSILVDLGLSPMLTREGARDEASRHRVLASILAVKIPLAIIVLVFIFVIVSLFGYEKGIRDLIMVAALVMVFDSFHLPLYAALRSMQKFQYEAWGVLLGQVCTMSLGVVVLFFHWPLVFLLSALLLGSFFNFLWAWRFCKKNDLAISFSRLSHPWSLLKPLLVLGFPFALAAVFTRVWTSLDSVMLSYFQGTEAVGLWSVPYKLVFALQFIPSALSSALFPAISAEYGKIISINNQDFSFKLNSLFRYLLIMAVPISAGTALLAPEIIQTVYGSAYLPSVPALQILVFILPFYFLNWQIGSILAGTGRQMRHALLLGVCMVCGILLNLILIPRLSFVGSAWSWLFGTVLFYLAGTMMIRKIFPLKLSTLFLPLGQIISAAVVMAWAVWETKDLWPVWVVVPLGAIVYGAGLIIFKAVSKEELRFFYTRIFIRKSI